MPETKLGWHSLATSFACACGVTHVLPIEVCHTGRDAAPRLAAFARARRCTSCFVLSDDNTRQAAGSAPLSALSSAGIQVVERVLPGTPIEATEDLARQVAEWSGEADCLVGIGAGTIGDLTKYAAHLRKRPALLYPTAASMNGYTSSIAALKVRGLKRTLSCAPALGIFSDPAVVSKAPRRMTAAGIADFLSKTSSSADWRASHLLRGCYYCARPREFAESIQPRIIDAATSIGAGNEQAVALLLDGLLLTGLAMVVAGSSAPASGGEHLISHYLDMKHALRGTACDLHGAQVGVATIYTLELWEQVLTLEVSDLDIEKLVLRQPTPAEIKARIEEDWGPIAEEVLAQWSEKALDPDALRGELSRFRDIFDSVSASVRSDLLPATVVSRAIREAGGPTRPEQLEAPLLEYNNAKRNARFLRNRFSILDLAAELGIT